MTPRIVFSERLNPLSVVSSSNELYNRGSVELYNGATSQYVPATVSMSADRLTATRYTHLGTASRTLCTISTLDTASTTTTLLATMAMASRALS